ncbi:MULTISPECIES: HD domain-containing protein [Mycolicibacterium]|nr:HD domain-containing protein [Mycolicibacterium fortuitum]MDV7195792.1 HD domain-containing protein [Mycolicibacterium fortuitum]MDV7231323.1 HD domain-containing protein [Mycolicibacterium fortuitum]MDV7288426.1 HD domain-containing protein [Mycolicibacterium fortuitum]MDV7331440.1 HD domain-containing protein [Mycolicibacterium fortuitum]STZ72594.1 metal dependent phosphohydrolase [Mycolicibacterium fortuitum]
MALSRTPRAALPSAPWATDALDLTTSEETPTVANHSVRSWIFAPMLAENKNLTDEVDESLLFAATVLHDIGVRRNTHAHGAP